MNVEYVCDIIRDLIPGYIDGVLSETGTEAVKRHLEQCEECLNIYEGLKADMEIETGTSEEELFVLDGFKKIKKRTQRLKLMIVVLSGLLITFLSAVFLKVFVIGKPSETHLIQVTDTVYDEETESLNIKGTLNSTGYRVSRVVWKQSKEDMDAVNVIVYAAETSPFTNKNKNFSIEIPGMKGRKAYLACPEYDQIEVYNWKADHYELMTRLEEEIISRIPGWNETRDVLEYSGGITIVGEEEGISYSVSHVIGEGATFWRFNDLIITDGDLEPDDFDIWISLKEPYQVLIYDYQTGKWSDSESVYGY